MQEEEDKNMSVESMNDEIIKTPGKPVMIWKLGSSEKGWIPNSTHFRIARKFIKESGLEKRYNVFLFHFGVDVQVVDHRPWWRKLLGI